MHAYMYLWVVNENNSESECTWIKLKINKYVK